MTSSQLRTNAREALKGKWGKAALITLVYLLITWVISWLLSFIPAIGSIISFVISLPLSYGLLVTFIKLKRGEEVTYTGFLTLGFSNFKRIWIVFGNQVLKLIVPIVLVVVFLLVIFLGGVGTGVGVAFESIGTTTGMAGITVVGLIGYIASLIYLVVKGYLYSLSYYILNDNPDKTGKEIVEESERLMRGNRWSFFWLGLTFIGWSILACITLGIGMLWLMPYILVTFIAFYENLAGVKNNVVVEAVKDEGPIHEAETTHKEEPVNDVNPIQEEETSEEDKTEE